MSGPLSTAGEDSSSRVLVLNTMPVDNDAGGENRTHKGLPPGDFKSPAFTISPPRRMYVLTSLCRLPPTHRTGLGDKLGDR